MIALSICNETKSSCDGAFNTIVFDLSWARFLLLFKLNKDTESVCRLQSYNDGGLLSGHLSVQKCNQTNLHQSDKACFKVSCLTIGSSVMQLHFFSVSFKRYDSVSSIQSSTCSIQDSFGSSRSLGNHSLPITQIVIVDNRVPKEPSKFHSNSSSPLLPGISTTTSFVCFSPFFSVFLNPLFPNNLAPSLPAQYSHTPGLSNKLTCAHKRAHTHTQD